MDYFEQFLTVTDDEVSDLNIKRNLTRILEDWENAITSHFPTPLFLF